MSIYNRLFDKEIRCEKCGNNSFWTIDNKKSILLCAAPVDNEMGYCGNEVNPETVFSPEKMLLFRRLSAIFRLFPSV